VSGNKDKELEDPTGYGAIETAVEAIKLGAEDYLTKPFDYEAVRKKIGRLMEVFELRERVAQLEANLESYPSFESVVYVSAPMQRVVERARAAALADAPILLVGETGTGKEMLARAIHAHPTLTETIGEAAEDIEHLAVHILRQEAKAAAR